jgi:hypothetical protein
VPGRSRYDGAEQAQVSVPDGTGGERDVAYLLPRTPGDPASMRPLARHRVVPDDRLDLVATRYLGDPLAFWLIGDANAALDPAALVGDDPEGTMIVIPAPGT